MRDFTSIPAISPAISFVIGIRGSLTRRMEISPTKATKSDVITIIPTVQAVDFKRIFEVLNLLIEIIADEKTIGTTR